MNVCKQMKNKLEFLDRKNYNVNFERGSAAREQIYIECSTANYEYLRYYLIHTLKEELNCKENMKKRVIATDLSGKSDIE